MTSPRNSWGYLDSFPFRVRERVENALFRVMGSVPLPPFSAFSFFSVTSPAVCCELPASSCGLWSFVASPLSAPPYLDRKAHSDGLADSSSNWSLSRPNFFRAVLVFYDSIHVFGEFLLFQPSIYFFSFPLGLPDSWALAVMYREPMIHATYPLFCRLLTSSHPLVALFRSVFVSLSLSRSGHFSTSTPCAYAS